MKSYASGVVLYSKCTCIPIPAQTARASSDFLSAAMRPTSSSMPQETQTKPSPTLSLSSERMLAWVMTAGQVMMLSTAPRFSHRLQGRLIEVHRLAAVGDPALDLEPQHAAVDTVAVLPVRQLLLRVGGQTQVPHHVDRWVGLESEELGHLLGVLGLLADPEHHGLSGLELK